MPVLGLLVVAAWPLLCCVVGTLRAQAHPVGDWWFRGLCLAGVVVGLAIALEWHDPDVSTRDYLLGLALAAFAGLVPPVAYYYLGRSLHRHRVTLAALFVVSMAPYFYFVLASAIFVADFVSCPPDAYECPL